MALTDNLIAFWELEEASGTRNDAHSTNHLTDTNTVTQATGKVGNAGQFTAANTEYLTLADNAAMSTGDIDYTFAGWAYLDNKSTFRIVLSKWGVGAGTNQEYQIRYSSSLDRYQFVIGGTSTVNTVDADNLGSPSVAAWYFIAAWHDSVANQIGISINAGTANTQAWTEGSVDSSYQFELGHGTQVGFPFDGRLDQWGFWKRVLTGAERTALYNGGSGLSYAAMGGGASGDIVIQMPDEL
jgi:hypothetical protein